MRTHFNVFCSQIFSFHLTLKISLHNPTAYQSVLATTIMKLLPTKIVWTILLSTHFNKLLYTHAAFVHSTDHSTANRCFALKMSRHDSSDEIKEALRISKEFGPTSKEARVAWDIVEEIDASDNIR